MTHHLQSTIELAWESRASISSALRASSDRSILGFPLGVSMSLISSSESPAACPRAIRPSRSITAGAEIATVLTLIILALTTIGLRFQTRSEDAQ